MNFDDVEFEARVMLRRAGFDDSQTPSMGALARAVLGSPVSVTSFRGLPGNGCLETVGSDTRIFVRRGLSKVALRFAIGHELGHFALELDSSCRRNEELCDAFAACLVLPRRAFALAVSVHGIDVPTIANAFSATESSVALRLGEVLHRPVALLSPGQARVRGPEFVWPRDWVGPRIVRIPMTERRRRAFAAESD